MRIREPDWLEHRMLKGPDTEIKLHVLSAGVSEVEKMLRLRDWLRASPQDREKYAEVKRGLAARSWRHVQHYADAKSTVISEILARAGWIESE